MSEQTGTTSPDVSPESSLSFRAWLRSWRYFIWLLIAGIVVALFYAEENWRGKRMWQRYKKQMEARGQVFDPAAFIPPPVPLSENFAMTPALAPLFEFISGTQKWRSTNAVALIQGFAPAYDAAARRIKTPKQDSRNAGSNSWARLPTDLRLWAAAFNTNGDVLVAGGDAPVPAGERAEAARQILTALSECDPVLEEIRTASKRPYSRFNLKYDDEDPAAILLPHLAIVKHICQVLQLRASAELALKRTDDAANDIELMFRLVDATRDEPIVISQIVRMAELRLALQPLAEGMSHWSEPQLRSFESRLLGFDFCADMKRALDSERVFFGGGVIDFVRRNPDKFEALAGGSGRPTGPGVIWGAAPSGWFDFERVNYSRTFENFPAPGLDLPNHVINPSAATNAVGRISDTVHQSFPMMLFRHRLFSALLIPDFLPLFRKTAFGQAGADLGAIACALEQYRLLHSRYPESLDILIGPPSTRTASGSSEGLLAKLPLDVITGQPLKYRRSAAGDYLLYSVGWNEKDDGGLVVRTKADVDVPLEGDWVWAPELGHSH